MEDDDNEWSRKLAHAGSRVVNRRRHSSPTASAGTAFQLNDLNFSSIDGRPVYHKTGLPPPGVDLSDEARSSSHKSSRPVTDLTTPISAYHKTGLPPPGMDLSNEARSSSHKSSRSVADLTTTASVYHKTGLPPPGVNLSNEARSSSHKSSRSVADLTTPTSLQRSRLPDLRVHTQFLSTSGSAILSRKAISSRSVSPFGQDSPSTSGHVKQCWGSSADGERNGHSSQSISRASSEPTLFPASGHVVTYNRSGSSSRHATEPTSMPFSRTSVTVAEDGYTAEQRAPPVDLETRQAAQAAFQTIMEGMKTGRRSSVSMGAATATLRQLEAGDASSSSTVDPKMQTARRQSNIMQLIRKARRFSNSNGGDEDECQEDSETPGAKVTSSVRFNLKPEELSAFKERIAEKVDGELSIEEVDTCDL